MPELSIWARISVSIGALSALFGGSLLCGTSFYVIWENLVLRVAPVAPHMSVWLIPVFGFCILNFFFLTLKGQADDPEDESEPEVLL